MLGGRGAISAVNHYIGRGEPRFDIAFVYLDVFEQVAVGAPLMQNRRARTQGLDRIANHRQVFVIDADQSQRPAGDFFIIRGHDGDCVSGITNLVCAQDRPVDGHQAMQVSAWYIPVRQYRMDAGDGASRSGIDRSNPGMWPACAKSACTEHPREVVIICEAGSPGDFGQCIRVGTGRANGRAWGQGFRNIGWNVLPIRLAYGADDALVAGAAAITVFEGRLDFVFAQRLIF